MVVYSIIVVAMTLLLLPRVAELVRDLGSWNRAYERQKKLLELQKLRYEVEVLRKTNGLNELSGLEILPNTSGRASGTAPASSAAADAKPDDRSSELVRLSWPMRWLYGAVGGLTPILIELVRANDLGTTVSLSLGFTLATLVFAVIGGVIAATALPAAQATPETCFVIGMAFPLFVRAVIVDRPSPQPASIALVGLCWLTPISPPLVNS